MRCWRRDVAELGTLTFLPHAEAYVAVGDFDGHIGLGKKCSSEVSTCVEINQRVGCTRQFFTKSFLDDDAAVLAPLSGEEPASPRHRAGVASMA